MASANDGRATAPKDMNGKSEADVQATRQPSNGDVGAPTDTAKSDKEAVTTRQVFETKDGTPVEPSTLLPKFRVGEPAPESRDDVVEITEGVDEDGNVVSRKKS